MSDTLPALTKIIRRMKADAVERDRLIRQARADGVMPKQISDVTGLARSRVHQIIRADDPPAHTSGGASG